MLAYISQTYAEALAMRLDLVYIPDAKSSKEQTGYIIMLAQFEEGVLLSETRNNIESSNQSDENSTLAPLFSEE